MLIQLQGQEDKMAKNHAGFSWSLEGDMENSPAVQHP